MIYGGIKNDINCNGRISTGDFISIKEATIEAKNNSVSFGKSAGKNKQGYGSVAVGTYSGESIQGERCIAVGGGAGRFNQGLLSTAIGYGAGRYDQKELSTSVGSFSGNSNQEARSTAIGYAAASNFQKDYSTAVGAYSGQLRQGERCTAIGSGAGRFFQSKESVAIGYKAAYDSIINIPDISGESFVAIGYEAGVLGMGSNSVAIGKFSGVSSNYVEVEVGITGVNDRDTDANLLQMSSNAIVINATGEPLNATTSGLFIKPIQDNTDITTGKAPLYYDKTTGEITSNTNISIVINNENLSLSESHSGCTIVINNTNEETIITLPQMSNYTSNIQFLFVINITSKNVYIKTIINDDNTRNTIVGIVSNNTIISSINGYGIKCDDILSPGSTISLSSLPYSSVSDTPAWFINSGGRADVDTGGFTIMTD